MIVAFRVTCGLLLILIGIMIYVYADRMPPFPR